MKYFRSILRTKRRYYDPAPNQFPETTFHPDMSLFSGRWLFPEPTLIYNTRFLQMSRGSDAMEGVTMGPTMGSAMNSISASIPDKNMTAKIGGTESFPPGQLPDLSMGPIMGSVERHSPSPTVSMNTESTTGSIDKSTSVPIQDLGDMGMTGLTMNSPTSRSPTTIADANTRGIMESPPKDNPLSTADADTRAITGQATSPYPASKTDMRIDSIMGSNPSRSPCLKFPSNPNLVSPQQSPPQPWIKSISPSKKTRIQPPRYIHSPSANDHTLLLQSSASDIIPVPAATRFPKFSTLPIELQIQIWEATLPGPRIVSVFQCFLSIFFCTGFLYEHGWGLVR